MSEPGLILGLLCLSELKLCVGKLEMSLALLGLEESLELCMLDLQLFVLVHCLAGGNREPTDMLLAGHTCESRV